jgi:hypothetical protein
VLGDYDQASGPEDAVHGLPLIPGQAGRSGAGTVLFWLSGRRVEADVDVLEALAALSLGLFRVCAPVSGRQDDVVGERG